jgi:type IV fimbrial biogenesis protein FimT
MQVKEVKCSIMSGMTMWRMKSGFTLVEMMVTIAIVAILIAISVPSYHSFIINTRMNAEINSLESALSMARSEAIKRGQTISVCPASSPTATTSTCDMGTDWSSGWVILVPNVAPPLQISSGVTHGDALKSTSTNTPSYPQFNAAGYTFFQDSITLHDSSNTGSSYHCINFSAGSWKVQKGASCP